MELWDGVWITAIMAVAWWGSRRPQVVYITKKTMVEREYYRRD